MYFRAIKHPIIGYDDCTTQKLVLHLQDTYTTLAKQEQHLISKCMIIPWSGEGLKSQQAKMTRESLLWKLQEINFLSSTSATHYVKP